MRSVWSALPAVSATLLSAPALANDAKIRFDIAALPLPAALAAFAQQAGSSIGAIGTLPAIIVRPVRGRMTAEEALARLLRGSGLEAELVSPMVYRLARRLPKTVSPEPIAGPDIVVTARKQREAASDIPAPIAVFVPSDAHRQGAATDTHAVAANTAGFTLTNLGPGRDKPFLRGVADSPFNGFSQSTVSFQLDEGRIVYDAAEPGLRLVDFERVEVLKGPQGPLYGTGALGGVYRIVSRRPLRDSMSGSAGLSLSTIAVGGGGADAEAVVNLPLIPRLAALRMVGYEAIEPGWIVDGNGRRGTNRSAVTGGRVALRIWPGQAWTIDISGTAQTTHVRNSQYVDRSAGDLSRTVTILEPRDGRMIVAQISASGSLANIPLTIATSYSWQDQDDLYDASGSTATLGVSAPSTYRDRRSYRVLDQEVRLNGRFGAPFGWTAGVSYLSASTQASGELSRATARPFFALHRGIVEAAVFADASAAIVEGLKAEAGIRVFRTTIDDELDISEARRLASRALVGVTPSTALSYEVASGTLAYVRYGRALRPGGIDPTNATTGRYDADEVGTIDAGGRVRTSGGRLNLDADTFRSTWRDIQSDYLRPNGLVATHNSGNAQILGVEFSADWRPRGDWRLRLGAAWQRGRLVSGIDGRDLPNDRRLAVTPDVMAHGEVQRSFGWRGWRVSPYLAGAFVGAARLSFDPGLDRRTPPYGVVRGGLELAWETTILRVGVENLLDAEADTFAFGNPFSIRSTRQFTPLRPRTVTLGWSRKF